MQFPRASGILLHPTSLPGRYGVGDLGEWAYRFVDFLVETGQTLWQMLPLGPTGYADSPYQSPSTFAGNPLIISLDKLVGDGWLNQSDLDDVPNFPADHVDYGWVIGYHEQKLALAFERFKAQNNPAQQNTFKSWCDKEGYWLNDYALFAALKRQFDLRPWTEWPPELAQQNPQAMQQVMQEQARNIEEQKFRQWVFHNHWYELKAYANQRGVRFVGDIPIFVAHDSSDVWGNKELYYLEPDGSPTFIAGVPPDYFSATGQRWGNPLYRWDEMANQKYDWWIKRIQKMLGFVDIIRIDHFRGFEAYWEIPGTEPTAVKGRWVPAPGFSFFSTLRSVLGEDLPIIAEDLGLITPGVQALRDEFNLPGMKVLQFAWGGRGGENSFLPHNHVPNCVVYSGTHDNNTTVGWWSNNEEVDDHIRHHLMSYINVHHIEEAHWTLIRLAMSSVANTAVVPMQDVLGLGADSRMNIPGTTGGNWTWRMTLDQFYNTPRQRLADLTRLYGRWPE